MDTRATDTPIEADARGTEKKRPRGRPFKKKQQDDVARSALVGDTRCSTDTRGADVSCEIAPITPVTPIDPDLNTAEINVAPQKLIQTEDEIIFSRGSDTLSIQLNRQPNNSYQIKIMLNGKNEMRPSTYNGARPALSYWNLLKEALE